MKIRYTTVCPYNNQVYGFTYKQGNLENMAKL